jgi:hypothetical protein
MNSPVTNAWTSLRSSVGRAAAGLSAFATLVWFLWPDEHWHVQPDAMAALAVAFIAWIASAVPNEPKRASQHDRELLQKFRALIAEDEKYFLGAFDLGNTFSWHDLEGTQALAERWHGAEYEFDDENVQKRFAPIVQCATELIRKMSLGTWIVSMDGKMASAIPIPQKASGNVSDETWARIKDYNDRATRLSTDIDAFIRYARQRIAD